MREGEKKKRYLAKNGMKLMLQEITVIAIFVLQRGFHNVLHYSEKIEALFFNEQQDFRL